MHTETQSLMDQLTQVLGPQHVIADQEANAYYSRDLSWEPYKVAAVVIQPGSSDELASAITTATQSSFAIVPRGGGMSYTQGYTPERSASVLVDMQRFNRIVEINTEDMYVTVECGCTWERLFQSLQKQHVRTPYWGPLSGKYATVGGAISQNSLFYGSAMYGSVADSVLGLEVVLADGSILKTGSGASRDGSPFFRYFGPDLTGLFLSDTGAFGVKTQATLKLIPLPEATASASFAFDSLYQLADAQKAMSRVRLAAEIYSFDPFYHRVFSELGFAFLADEDWSLHVVVDSCDAQIATRTLEILRTIALKEGREIDGSVPPAIRSDPFGAVRPVLLGPEGQNWLPIHTFLPLSKTQSVLEATRNLFESNAETMRIHSIEVSYLTATSGTDFVFEPSFYWPDELGQFRLERIESEFAERWQSIKANPTARQIVLDLRRQLGQIFTDMGGVNIQIGKYYPYQSNMSQKRWDVIKQLKQLLDPKGLMNPGCLGLH